MTWILRVAALLLFAAFLYLYVNQNSKEYLVVLPREIVQLKNSVSTWIKNDSSSAGIEVDSSSSVIKNDSPSSGPVVAAPKHCYVNIYGLPRSGTGILQRQLISAAGTEDSSWFHDTGIPEDEGYHLTKALPLLHLYYPTACSRKNEVDVAVDFGLCPRQLDKFTTCNEKTTAMVLRDWGRYWNVSKPFLFQKTPNMKMWILDRCLPKLTIHVMSLRHPLFWRFNRLRDKRCTARNLPRRLCHVFWWLQIWEALFEYQFFGLQDRVFVVQYESLHGRSDNLKFVRGACNMSNQVERRQLNLKEGGTWNESFVWKTEDMIWWKACLADPVCNRCLKAGEVGANALGYSLMDAKNPVSNDVKRYPPVLTSTSLNNNATARLLGTSREHMLQNCNFPEPNGTSFR